MMRPLTNIVFSGGRVMARAYALLSLLIITGALRPLSLAQEPSAQTPTINRQSISDFTNNVIPNYPCRDCTEQSRKLLNNRSTLSSSPQRDRHAAAGRLSDCETGAGGLRRPGDKPPARRRGARTEEAQPGLLHHLQRGSRK